jgi:AhpD family alkylhydroperoxidase
VRIAGAAEEGPTAELVRARRGGQLSDLDRLLLHSPPVAEGWNALLGALRSGTTLPGDVRELVVLRIAVLNGADFEWAAHEPIGRRAGLTAAQLAALRDDGAAPDPAWSSLQAAALAWTDATTRSVAVPDEVFTAARALLDDRGLVELAVLAGGYAMVSRVLVAFDVPPPAGEVAG